MNSKKRNKSKHKGLNRIIFSSKYSIEGLAYAYKTEKSLVLHSILSTCAIILGFVLNISINQWIVLLIALGVILMIELLNTAIEAVVDMVTLEYNELAKIAKDCGSAGAFVASIIGLIIALVIFIPKIIALL